VQQFIAQLVQQDGFDKAWLEKAFDSAHRRDSILAAIAKPYEAKPWYQYKPLFVTSARINSGVAFWDAHSALLDKVQKQYGVSPAIIVAILGVESFYGRQKGGFPVLDALTTLSFDYPPRASFFQAELQQYLLMCREHAFDPPSLMGSYAGAMGAPQFMPDSYRQYAVAFDGQGQPDIWNDWADIIASVANYFQLHGWQADGLVAVPAALRSIVAQTPATLTPTTVGALRSGGVVVSQGLADDTPVILVPLQLEQGTEYWLGLHNFRVILAYNKSPLYAMAVYDLATRIIKARAQGRENVPP
ncbi:MAG: lytic murein transglycosylase B, partial [Gammaproteobacteria bacterium]